MRDDPWSSCCFSREVNQTIRPVVVPAMESPKLSVSTAASPVPPDSVPGSGQPSPQLASQSQNLMSYLLRLSGQEKESSVIDFDHNYSKPWNRHPDPNIRARPARFLFMRDFPRHFRRKENPEEDIGVISSETEQEVNPFQYEASTMTTPKTPLTPMDLVDTHEGPDLPPPNKTGWTSQMHKLWTRSLKILQADRLNRLTYSGLPNEIILKKNLQDKTCTKFRQLFASVARWEEKILLWLQTVLHAHVAPIFLIAYHEAMQLLRQKVVATPSPQAPNFSILL